MARDRDHPNALGTPPTTQLPQLAKSLTHSPAYLTRYMPVIPSEARVKRGDRGVRGEVEFIEKLG